MKKIDVHTDILDTGLIVRQKESSSNLISHFVFTPNGSNQTNQTIALCMTASPIHKKENTEVETLLKEVEKNKKTYIQAHKNILTPNTGR